MAPRRRLVRLNWRLLIRSGSCTTGHAALEQVNMCETRVGVVSELQAIIPVMLLAVQVPRIHPHPEDQSEERVIDHPE